MKKNNKTIKDCVRNIEVPDVKNFNGVYYRTFQQAWTSGWYSKMTTRVFTTLCAIAAYMDKDGICYPTQKTLAKNMGISERQANERIKELLNYRDEEGNPIIIMAKDKVASTGLRRCAYRILPNSGMIIFDPATDKADIG